MDTPITPRTVVIAQIEARRALDLVVTDYKKDRAEQNEAFRVYELAMEKAWAMHELDIVNA